MPIKSDAIYLDLIKKVESGQLKPGDKLPTQRELAEEFNCSLAPVKQALTKLSIEGVVTSSTAGTFVSQATPTLSGNLLSSHAVHQDPAGFDDDHEEKILFAERVQVEGRPAEMLGLENGSLAIRRDRQRFAGGKPITMSSAWVPWEIGRHQAELLIKETGPGQKGLEKASGLKAVRLEEWIRADKATPEQAVFFGIDEGAPVKIVDHLWITGDQTVMVYGSGVHPGDQWSKFWVNISDG